MANSNPSGLRASEQEIDPGTPQLEPWMSDQEVEDIANGLAASLDTPQTTPHHVLLAGDWTPESKEQWQTFERQKKVLEEANFARNFPGYHEAIRQSMETAHPRQMVHALTDAGEKWGDVNSAQVAGNERLSAAAAPGSLSVINDIAQITTAARIPANLDELITDMQVKLALQVPSLNEVDGDTYVFLDRT